MNRPNPNFFTNQDDVTLWLKKMKIYQFILDKNLTVHVNGDINLYKKKLSFLPVQFGEVGGVFDISYNKLTTLEGVPTLIHQDFDCSHNKLTSLTFAPKNISGQFDCSHNKLGNLLNSPDVGTHYDCSYNKLNTLDGIQSNIYGSLNCQHNQLTDILAIKEVTGFLNCSDNTLDYLDLNVFKHLTILPHHFQNLSVLFMSKNETLIQKLSEFSLDFVVNEHNLRVDFDTYKIFLEKNLVEGCLLTEKTQYKATLKI
jgi:hypothetical protein